MSRSSGAKPHVWLLNVLFSSYLCATFPLLLIQLRAGQANPASDQYFTSPAHTLDCIQDRAQLVSLFTSSSHQSSLSHSGWGIDVHLKLYGLNALDRFCTIRADLFAVVAIAVGRIHACPISAPREIAPSASNQAELACFMTGGFQQTRARVIPAALRRQPTPPHAAPSMSERILLNPLHAWMLIVFVRMLCTPRDN